MEVLFRLVASVLGESSIVHEKIRFSCQCFHLRRRTSVDSINDLQSWAWLLDNLARRDCFPFDVDLLSHLKLFPQRSLRDASPFCFFRMKPARPVRLNNCIREAGNVVHCRGRHDLVTVFRYFLSRFELCDSYTEGYGES